MVESKLYAVLVGEKSITHYYGADIVMLIELGIFHPEDYIYCFTSSAWMKADECEEISQYLTLNAYRRSKEVHLTAPTFCPPPAPQNAPYSLKTVLEGGIIVQEEELAKRASFLEEQFSALSEENLRLSKLVKKLKPESGSDAAILTESIEMKDSELVASKKQLEIATQENKKLAEAIIEQGMKLKELSSSHKSGDANVELIKDLHHLRKSLQKKESKIIGLERNLKKNKKEMKSLNSLKEERDQQRLLEEKRLIGESFKVVNSAQWMIKREGQEKGPYRFSDVSDWYAKKLLGKKTLVKRISEKVFSRLEDIYEFNTKVVERLEDSEDGFHKVFYIRRTDFRAPFYEVATIEIEGEEQRAQCTSLSIGGCFMELKDLTAIKVNSILKCRVNTEYLSMPIDATIIVKNIKKGRSKGVGCQFLDLEAEQRSSIEEFVKSYLDSQSSEKKAA